MHTERAFLGPLWQAAAALAPLVLLVALAALFLVAPRRPLSLWQRPPSAGLGSFHSA